MKLVRRVCTGVALCSVPVTTALGCSSTDSGSGGPPDGGAYAMMALDGGQADAATVETGWASVEAGADAGRGDGGLFAGVGTGEAGTEGGGALCSADVAAITPEQIKTFTAQQVVALGTNIRCLSDGALGALSGNGNVVLGQIAAITAAQVVVLTPAQIRLLGATGAGGATMTSKLADLNSGAWAALVQDSTQVAAITAAEVPTLSTDKITALGANIKFLSDGALGALSGNGNVVLGQIAAITAAQVTALSPHQVSIVAAINNDAGISFLNTQAFAALSAAQIAVLTVAQRASLSPAQHTACGC